MKTINNQGAQETPTIKFKGALFNSNQPTGMLTSDGIDFSDIQNTIGWTMIVMNISLILECIELSFVLHLSPYVIDIRQEVDTLLDLSFYGLYSSECIICNTLLYLADIPRKNRKILPCLGRINLIIGIIMLICFVGIIVALGLGNLEKEIPFGITLISELPTQRVILFFIVGRGVINCLRLYDENKIV